MVITTIARPIPEEQIWAEWEEAKEVILWRKQSAVPSLPLFAPTDPLVKGTWKRS